MSLNPTYCQDFKQLKGQVFFGQVLIAKANVEIVNKGFTRSVITDSQGTFKFSDLPNQLEKITVKISHLQFKSVTIEIPLLSNNTDSNLFFVEEINKTLNEVSISGVKRKFIKREADKTVIYISNNDLLSSGSTFEAITKLPGVIITTDGLVGQNGRLSAIFIDGEPTGFSGDNLVNFLNSLPANSIEKIELIPNPGAKYQASFSGGIINIITKNIKTKGYTLTINTTTRINRNLKSGNSLQLLTKIGQLNWNLFVGNNNNTSNQTERFVNTFENQVNQPVLTENREPIFKYDGYYARNGFRYNLSKKSSVLLNYNLNISKNNNLGKTENFSKNFNSTSKSKLFNSSSNNELILKLKQKIDTVGTQFDLTCYANFYNQEKDNKLSEFNINNRYSFTAFDLFTRNLYTNLETEIPLKKYKLSFNFGGRYGNFKASNYGKYIFNSSSADIFISPLFESTIPFEFENRNMAGYLSINKKIKKLSLTAGIRYENIIYKSNLSLEESYINRKFSNFFPNFNLSYDLNSSISVGSSYSKKINLPNYTNFDPNNNLNSFYINNIGNPLLEPEIGNNYDIKLTFFDYAYLSYSFSNQETRNVTYYKNDNSSLNITQTLLTLNNVQVKSVNLGIPIPFGLFTEGKAFFEKRATVDSNKTSYLFADLSYNKTSFNNVFYDNFEKGSFNMYLYSQIILKDNYKMFVNYNFTSKGSVDIYNLNAPIQNLDVNFSSRFINNKLVAVVGVLNVLNSAGFNADFKGLNVSSSYNRLNETWMLKVSLTYNFGSFKSKNDEDFNQKNEPTANPVN